MKHQRKNLGKSLDFFGLGLGDDETVTIST